MNDRSLGNWIGAAILVGGAVLVWLWIDSRGGVFANYNAENESYASTYFDGLFPYEAVLASQKWHPRRAEAWDCTYAVVSLGNDAPAVPSVRDRTVLGWQFAWGGEWSNTPAPQLGDSIRDAISFCSQRLPDGLGIQIQAAMQTEGNFFVRDSIGETVFVYAPENNLAARIRFGD